MSSLRNAVKRVTHKERSQPTSRAHLGLLEKKKDYRIRAKDYHKKQDALKNLRRKASEKNPDEFYFGMNNSQIVDGRHRKLDKARQEERAHEIGPEAVKLMKSQDLSYIRTEIQKDKKKVERLQASLHFVGENTERKHTIFVNNKAEKQNFDMAKHFDCPAELCERSFNRPRKATLLERQRQSTDEGDYDGDETEEKALSDKKLGLAKLREKRMIEKLARHRCAAYRELEARTERIEKLKEAENQLITEKIVASKGRKRKIKAAENGKPAVFKFRRKRLG